MTGRRDSGLTGLLMWFPQVSVADIGVVRVTGDYDGLKRGASPALRPTLLAITAFPPPLTRSGLGPSQIRLTGSTGKNWDWNPGTI